MNDGITCLEKIEIFKKISKLLTPENWQKNGDTYPEMNWREFKNCLEKSGFVNAYSHKFSISRCPGIYEEWVTDEEILWNREGIIICAKSAGGIDVDIATAYGEVEYGKNGLGYWQMLALKDCKYEDNNNGTWNFQFDAMRGLNSHINAINLIFEMSKKWTKPQRLNLINYTDENYGIICSEDQIVNAKLKWSSPEIQEVILGHRL